MTPNSKKELPPQKGIEREMYDRGWRDAWLAAADEYDDDDPDYTKGFYDGTQQTLMAVAIGAIIGLIGYIVLVNYSPL